MTTTTRLGIDITADECGVPVDHNFALYGSVSTKVEAGADAAGMGGRLRFDFASAGAFVWKSCAVRRQRLADLPDLQRQVLACTGWDPRWTVVTEVGLGGPSCILVALEAGAFAMVSLASGPALPIGLAEGFSLGSRQGMAATLVTSERCPVLIGGHYLRRWPFRNPRLADRGPADAGRDRVPVVPGERVARLVQVVNPDDNPGPDIH